MKTSKYSVLTQLTETKVIAVIGGYETEEIIQSTKAAVEGGFRANIYSSRNAIIAKKEFE